MAKNTNTRTGTKEEGMNTRWGQDADWTWEVGEGVRDDAWDFSWGDGV